MNRISNFSKGIPYLPRSCHRLMLGEGPGLPELRKCPGLRQFIGHPVIITFLSKGEGLLETIGSVILQDVKAKIGQKGRNSHFNIVALTFEDKEMIFLEGSEEDYASVPNLPVKGLLKKVQRIEQKRIELKK